MLIVARTKAEDKLSRKTPTSDLLSIRVLLSLFGQVGLQLAFQVFIFLNVRAQSWYQKPAAEPGLEIISSYENAVLFRFSIFVYLFLSWILSIGRPFRRPLLTNVPFTISALILGGCCATLLFLSHPWILDTFELKRVPWNYRVFLSLMIGVYLVGAYMFEKVVECL
jgi:cation-transporting ATPase 13A3/4/5